MTLRSRLLPLLGLAALALVACGPDDEGCLVRDDCPDGYACVLGECRPEVSPDAGLDGGVADARPDAAPPADARPDAATDGSVGCTYVDDGVIQRSELVFEVGLGATYKINTDAPVTVDLMGTEVGGEPQWDYSASTPPEASVVDELLPVSGNWFAADFPDATYSATLDAEAGVLGVFKVTDTALQMLGAVSVEANVTKLVYDPPVDLLRFPIALNDHFVVESVSSGTYNYIYTYATESYDTTVDALGTVIVPAGSFHALRVRTRFSQTIGYLVTTRIIYLYVTECFGIVAKITSEDNEAETIFTDAAELRRMTL
jgi:hypothetical protein